jgi:hypothetical protein
MFISLLYYRFHLLLIYKATVFMDMLFFPAGYCRHTKSEQALLTM